MHIVLYIIYRKKIYLYNKLFIERKLPLRYKVKGFIYFYLNINIIEVADFFSKSCTRLINVTLGYQKDDKTPRSLHFDEHPYITLHIRI